MANPWKTASLYTDVVFRFSLGVAACFLLFHWIGTKAGWPLLGLLGLFIGFPLCFYQMMLSLRKLQDKAEHE